MKQLMIRKKLEDKRKALEALQEQAEALNTRESELESAIQEAESDEEKEAVEQAVSEHEAEKAENAAQVEALESEIAELDKELADMEAKTEQAPAESESNAAPAERARVMSVQNRGDFFGLNIQERKAIMEDPNFRSFMESVRAITSRSMDKRAVENINLTIPEVILPLVKQVIEENSIMMPLISTGHVSGNARQVGMGDYPEGVWTDCCANINELDLSLWDVEWGCWKISGYFDLCNATLEDSDIALAREVINAIGIAISKGYDKATVYGKGTKMPLGIVTRLNQTSEPSDYLPTGRPWADLHTSNVIAGTGKTGLALFQEIAAHKKAIKNNYFKGGLAWLMSENTHTDLLIASMDKNLNAAIVAGIGDSMPVLGGKIVEVPFIPDGEIVAGYMPAYRMVERAGKKFATSEHYRFLEDRTVFKGTARYDGKPVIPEAFVVFSITSSAPTPASKIVFPADTANQTQGGGGTSGGGGTNP